MEHYRWTSLLFFAVVLHSATPFKIPGLSSGSRSPPASNKAAGSSHKGADGGEYVGPVFIIRELNKETGEYDAFITTGGIQEVKPPHPHHQQHPNHQQHPYEQHQNQYHPNPQYPHVKQPSPQQHPNLQQQQDQQLVAAKETEDSEYFGVLVTAETVKALNHPKSAYINVSVSVLLTATSSRMPWLLVLHRKDYPHLFEYQQQQKPGSQDQLPQPGIPGMQVPQRRRYYSERQRRGLYSRTTPQNQGRWAQGYQDEDEEQERITPVLFERELLSTICYNFAQDTDAAAGLGARLDRTGPFFDANAYAAAVAPTTQSAAQPSVPENLPMDIPKRVS
ncbi:probable serine/threonine-protein kinase DDB_G0280133 [Sipha flava]|uniref:Probable serine/threonine-protein kinase DDB_G0280133 n=3 Tax=Sipha flava TaxID=143950 RepID=A0A8B8GA80_9HEMI|nr:probable serine/threonine-protein kinase DDB_G0280133 [Sipha flava]